MIDDLMRFLRLQGVTPAGIHSVEPKLPDWERFLRSRGVTEVPDMLAATGWTRQQADDYFQVMTLFSQESQAQHKRLKIPRQQERMIAEWAHKIRDVSGVRDFEPENERGPEP